MQRCDHVGVLVDPATEYFRRVCVGISRAIRLRGSWSASLAGLVGGRSAHLLDQPLDGVLAAITPSNPILDRIKTLRIPVVNFSGAMPDGAFPTVRPDDAQIGAMAARHLRDLNIEHFACLHCDMRAHAQRRRKAFLAELRLLGVGDSHLHVLSEQAFTAGQPRNPVIGRWLADLPRPVGLYADQDLQAYTLCGLCRQGGLDVPNDVAILGVDNDPLLCELACPPLSSIRLATRRIGQTAVAMLGDLLDGRPAPAEPVLIPPLGVVRRGSTDMLAIDDVDLAAAVHFIRNHAVEGIGVADVLQAVPLSRRGLERRFSAVFGRSPGQEIRRVQLDHARFLLLTSADPLPSIARRSGFGSADRFTRIFHRAFGVPPSRYRQQYPRG